MASRKLVLLSFMLVVAAAVLVSTAIADGGPGYEMVSEGGSGPDVARCLDETDCFLKLMFCPWECKHRYQQFGRGEKACFISCEKHKCETSCRYRKPKCLGWGSVCYDPRLVGGDGSMFYFHGEKNQDFCLVSDRTVHINGHFIGLRPEGRSRDFTWVQALGMLFGSHQFSIGAKKVAQWDDEVDQLLFSYDGVPFGLEEEIGADWVSNDGQLRVERTYHKNVVEVVLYKSLSMLIQVVPITPAEDKAHNYQLPSGDVFAHLDLEFKFNNLSSNVDGVLGQTYQPDYVSSAKVGVKMPVLGGEDRFFATGLLNADCKASQFIPETIQPDEIQDLTILEQISTQCSSQASGTGIVCRR